MTQSGNQKQQNNITNLNIQIGHINSYCVSASDIPMEPINDL